MYSFEEIKLNHDKLIQTKKAQIKFIKTKKEILKVYNTFEDYVKVKYFNFSPINIDNKIKSMKNKDSKTYYIGKNDFPYNVSKNINHWILFSIKPLSIKNQQKIIEQSIPKNSEYVFYMNPIEHQNMPDLWHIQIFWI